MGPGSLLLYVVGLGVQSHLAMEERADDYSLLIYIAVVVLLFIGACWAFGFVYWRGLTESLLEPSQTGHWQ